MAKVLEMPKLSPTMTEGQLTIWHKKEGDAVAVDDLLAEVETDKATMEFRSFDKGTLLKLLEQCSLVERSELHRRLVGLDFGEQIVDGDGVAFFLVPDRELPLGHRGRQLGHLQYFGHFSPNR